MNNASPTPDRADLVRYFDELAPGRDRWRVRNRYYHQQLAHTFTFLIPPGRAVLEVGSGTGELLAALQPQRGLGIDVSPAMTSLAQVKFPHLEFRTCDIEQLPLNEKFDYVVMSDLIGFLHDVQRSLENLRQVCSPQTRVVISYYNFLWEPLLKLAERLHLKARQPVLNWVAPADVENMLDLAGFEGVRKLTRLVLPLNVPLLSPLCNRLLANLPGIRKLSLVSVLVARPQPVARSTTPRVSVIIPARNERGNIEAVVTRTPELGAATELIFVEGNSSDGTAEEIQRVIARHPERRIKLVLQGQGRGKGDAVRRGFAAATGELLMILDADLTMPPEELPKYCEALVSRKVEFVHGSRLVYPMDQQAMRSLNILGNKFFSLAFSYLLDQRFKDTLCGTKALWRADYEQISAGRAYFGDFDPFGDFDLIFGAAKLNLKIKEIPIHYKERSYGTTQISRFRHGWLLLQMTWFAMWKMKFV